MRVYTGHKSLCSSLFVAGSAVYLACKIKVLHTLGFKGCIKLRRVEEVIFNRICRLENLSILQTSDLVKGFYLDIERKRRRKTLEVVFSSIGTFRFQEQLVCVVLREHPKFVLNAGAIPRAYAMDQAGKKRRIFKA